MSRGIRERWIAAKMGNRENNRTVLLVVGSLSAGGAERVTVDLYDYLLNRGWDAHLFVTYWGNSKTRIYLPRHMENMHHVRTIANTTILSFLNLVFLKRLIGIIHPDWVVSLGASYRLISASGAFDKCKVLLSERNWPIAYYSAAEMERVEQFYKNATAVVFQTSDAKGCFGKEVQRKSVVIPNPVSDNLPVWEGRESKQIIYYGRLDAQKRPEMALNAFEIFAKAHPGFTLEFYGIGSQEPSLRIATNNKGLSESVFFHAPSKLIHSIASKSRMYLNSSDYEGISNAMLEALSMGIPCICTDCGGGGARLAIDNGTNGILVPRDDEKAMARAMDELVRNPSIAEQLSKNAISSMKRFSKDSVMPKWEEVLRA